MTTDQQREQDRLATIERLLAEHPKIATAARMFDEAAIRCHCKHCRGKFIALCAQEPHSTAMLSTADLERR